MTNCSNNYGSYPIPKKLRLLFINNISLSKPLSIYSKGENLYDWLYMVDYACSIYPDFNEGKIAEIYNIGGFNEWNIIDIIKVLNKTIDRLLGYKESEDLDLINYVTYHVGHGQR